MGPTPSERLNHHGAVAGSNAGGRTEALVKEGLGGNDGFGNGLAEGDGRGDGSGEDAAGAVRGAGFDARAAEPERLCAVRPVVLALVSFSMSAIRSCT